VYWKGSRWYGTERFLMSIEVDFPSFTGKNCDKLKKKKFVHWSGFESVRSRIQTRRTVAADIALTLQVWKLKESGSNFLSNAPRLPKQHCFLEGSQVSPVRPPGKGRTQIMMRIDHCWNRADKEKSKHSEKTLSQCHRSHHKSHKDWPGIEMGPPGWQAGAMPQPKKNNTNPTLFKVSVRTAQ